MKREKKIKRSENEKSVSKKRAWILIASVVVAILLLVPLSFVDFDALADKIVHGNKDQNKDLISYPDHYFEDPVYDEDITKDEKYMEKKRYVELKIGNEINSLGDSSEYDEGTLERFWADYFDAVKSADSETLNSLHTDHFVSQNGKFGKFAPQKLYKIIVEMVKSTLIEEGEYSGCYQHFATVNYYIYENNGTFRTDIVSDESREQIVELIESRSGIKINAVSYVIENAPGDENDGFSFMAIVWFILIIFSVAIGLMTMSLIVIWFIPAGIIAFILSLFKVNVAVQVIAYVLSAALLIVLYKTLWKKKILTQKEETDEQKAIGSVATVVERIDPDENTGKVSVNGKVWLARMTDAGTCEVGESVTVVRFDKDTLYCEREQRQSQ